jgi:hypothetical protein
MLIAERHEPEGLLRNGTRVRRSSAPSSSWRHQFVKSEAEENEKFAAAPPQHAPHSMLLNRAAATLMGLGN